MEKITLGSGCFWCTEAIFRNLKGVESAVSGYSGGKTKDPFYKEVCSGTTGHAEVVQVTFDPAVISLTEILEVFWKMHDPTTLNRQGNDVGTQYRSVVFYHDDQQKEVAETIKVELTKAKIWNDSIVTEISPISMFYTAENYHQDYLASHGSEPYCQFVVTPKVKKFKEIFADKLK
ncbi:MAG: peptide-methionine (S)-S-oxide reductase [Marinoscillum sp.]|jgi:peptide-methionine (S)-S-oxide reductase